MLVVVWAAVSVVSVGSVTGPLVVGLWQDARASVTTRTRHIAANLVRKRIMDLMFKAPSFCLHLSTIIVHILDGIVTEKIRGTGRGRQAG
ncbi:MAG: hypothetical protein LRY35_03305, partial [Clostridiales bacterium]|nr:hypothetical protein [Clostridiales bacterium]